MADITNMMRAQERAQRTAYGHDALSSQRSICTPDYQVIPTPDPASIPHRPSDDLLPLHEYQRIAREYILTRPSCALWLDMGLGKTLVTLAALYDLNCPCHVLIVAPKVIARSTWTNEIKNWNLPLRTCSLITNERGTQLTKKKRLELYAEVPNMPPTLFFLNRELLPQIVDATPKGAWPFPVVVLDEAQGFKSHSSSRFSALKEMLPYIQKVIELTGTPMPNSLHDLWAQAYLLDQGARLGKNITTFRNRWLVPGVIVNEIPVTYNPRPGAFDDVKSRMEGVALSMKNTLLKLPSLTMNDIRITMEDKERKLYDKLMKTKVIQLDSGDEVAAENPAVLQSKLSQMASGSLYVDEDHNFETIHELKVDWTQRIVEQTPTPTLVAYWFKTDLYALQRRFDEENMPYRVFDGKPETIDAWNAGRIKTMFIQPMSAGFGVNLQQGGHTLVWYTIPWSLEAYMQTNARLYRQGQTEPVVIHRLLMSRSIDMKIRRSLDEKDMSQESLLNAVRYAISPDESED